MRVRDLARTEVFSYDHKKNLTTRRFHRQKTRRNREKARSRQRCVSQNIAAVEMGQVTIQAQFVTPAHYAAKIQTPNCKGIIEMDSKDAPMVVWALLTGMTTKELLGIEQRVNDGYAKEKIQRAQRGKK
jgi:hypothetical protein